VSLSTAKYLNTAAENPLQFNQEIGWQEISKGLKLVVRGYWVLIVGGLVGPGLLWQAVQGAPASAWLGSAKHDRDTLLLVSILTLAVTALLSYALVLCGQWRCLMYAPQSQSAKELMYVCLYCVVVAALLNLAGICLDGGRTWSALQEGWTDLTRRDNWSVALLFQFGSGVVGLIGTLVFSQFLRNVASCFQDKRRVRRVDFNLAFVGLLLGGTIGTLFLVPHLAERAELLPWLAGGWLACFAWHLWLVWDVGRCVEAGLRKTVSRQVALVRVEQAAGSVAMHTLSGLRRLATKGNE
jgi:hypothetical protein